MSMFTTRGRALGGALASVMAAVVLVPLAAGPAQAEDVISLEHTELEWDGEELQTWGKAKCDHWASHRPNTATVSGYVSQDGAPGAMGRVVTAPFPCDGKQHDWTMWLKPKSGTYKDGAAKAWVSLNRGNISYARLTKQVTISGMNDGGCDDFC